MDSPPVDPDYSIRCLQVSGRQSATQPMIAEDVFRSRVILVAMTAIVASPFGALSGQGVIRGRVIDGAGSPVREASVETAGGTRRARTDSAGRFELVRVPIGRHDILVKRIGYDPKTTTLTVGQGETVDVEIVLTQRAQPLPTVAVEKESERPVPYRLRDFERRRSSGVGHFLTEADLAADRSKPLGDVLVRLPGAQVVRYMTAACLTTSRGAQSFSRTASGHCGGRETGASNCPVAVFVDGFPAYTGDSDDIFDLNTLRAADVAGVEFYAGAGTVPREFGAPRGTCGVLVLWTKR